MNKIQRSESFHLAIILAVIGKYLDAYTYFVEIECVQMHR